MSNDFYRRKFFRGITSPPANSVTVEGRFAYESVFPGDLIIT
jgi:hypothetical protein